LILCICMVPRLIKLYQSILDGQVVGLIALLWKYYLGAMVLYLDVVDWSGSRMLWNGRCLTIVTEEELDLANRESTKSICQGRRAFKTNEHRGGKSISWKRQDCIWKVCKDTLHKALNSPFSEMTRMWSKTNKGEVEWEGDWDIIMSMKDDWHLRKAHQQKNSQVCLKAQV